MELREGVWVAKYPWLRNPDELPDNKHSALAMLRSTEKRLKRDENLAQIYSDQVKDMVDRGVARKLQPEEMEAYDGPYYYISHHEVMNPKSHSTPCRLVFNSSAKFNNVILNDFWAKGPDMMNNLLGVLLRFRGDRVAVAGDIKKMYHTVKIEGVDQQTHRFLWRDLEDRPPDVYVITSVSFGDKPAAAMAAVALKKTAELSKEEYPRAAEIIINSSYVDDIISSFADQEEAHKIITHINEVLLRGGFRVKAWRVSGQTTEEGLEICTTVDNFDSNDSTDTKVLGIVWNPSNDELEFRTKLNFSPRQRKVRTEPDISEDEVNDRIPVILTKRLLLSQVNGIYDPMGLASPFVIRAKILLRNLNALQLDWDDPIPEIEREKWVIFFTELYDIQRVKFKRSTKPPQTKGRPVLVIFSDASEAAFGACAYIRWEKEDGTYESRLLLAKSRLAPLKKITIVRLELNGALLSARLREFITKQCNLEFRRTYLLVDSEIVRAMIQKDSYGYHTFASVRVGEIQEKTNKDEWFWIEGAINIADIISRGVAAKDLVGEWQKGPAFLAEPEEDWPVYQSCSEQELPEQKVLSATLQVPPIGPRVVTDLSRFSNYDKLVRVIARIFNAFTKNPRPSFRNIARHPSRDEIHQAEKYLITASQKTLHDDVKHQTITRLGTRTIDGVVVVGSRLESLDDPLNAKSPVLLSSKSVVAQLYARKVHNECHLGISALASKIRAKYWIVGIRQLLKSIKFHCVTCRKLGAELQQQRMGPLPSFRLKPAPAWSYTSLDLFGPFEIKGEVNKRTRSKGYGIIFTCMLSRAVHLDIATDYGTDAFLQVLRRFIAMRGSPNLIWSDQGSQLTAADKEMKDAVAKLNENEIQEFGSIHEIDWKFSAPDAPWQNGCAEALIKSVKKSLKIAIGEQILTFSEMQTVLFEVASLINERPIGRHPTSADEGTYLSPNDLLLGRSSKKIPGGPFNMTTSKYTRHRLVQKINEAFWKRWTEDYFPSLIVQQKWHARHRNMKVGDIVMIQESGKIMGKWKLGRLVKAEPSLRDGLVRKVDVQYKSPESQTSIIVTRAVQRLVVIAPVDEDQDYNEFLDDTSSQHTDYAATGATRLAAISHIGSAPTTAAQVSATSCAGTAAPATFAGLAACEMARSVATSHARSRG